MALSCNAYFGKVFAHLAGAMAVAAASAETVNITTDMLKGMSPFAVNIINAIITFLLLFGVMLLPPGSPLKYIAFAGFAVMIGQIIQPLVKDLVEKGSLTRILSLTTGVFVGMMALGFYDKQNLLGFGPFLLAGLIGLIIAQIAVYIFASPEQKEKAVNVFGIIGVGLFAVFTAYDVQLLKRSAKWCRKFKKAGFSPDYPRASLGLFLDFVNLFGAMGQQN